jgi:uncharacterized membrane protein
MCRVLHVPLTVVQVIWKKKKKKFPNSVVELCFFFFFRWSNCVGYKDNVNYIILNNVT